MKIINRFLQFQVIIFILLLSAILGLTVQAAYSRLFHTGKAEYTSVYPDGLKETSGLNEVSDGSYVTVNGDSQIHLSFPAKKTNAVIIRFSSSIASSVPVEIYFSENGDPFAEDRIVTGAYTTDKKDLLIKTPQGDFTDLRIDIGKKENIFFSLSNIQIVYMEKTFSWFVFLPVFLLSFFMLLGKRETIRKVTRRYTGKPGEILLNAALCTVIPHFFGSTLIYLPITRIAAIFLIFLEAGYLVKRCRREEKQ